MWNLVMSNKSQILICPSSTIFTSNSSVYLSTLKVEEAFSGRGRHGRVYHCDKIGI